MNAVLLLLFTGIIGMVLARFTRFSAVIGYFIAGIVIGPHGWGLVAESEYLHLLAEMGVVLLLFDIGLHLSVRRMWRLRNELFVLGPLQAAAASLVLGLAAWWLGMPPVAAIIIGIGLSQSSTAIVLQLMMERQESGSPLGQSAISILVFQDILIVFLLVLIPALGGSSDQPLMVTIGMSLAKAVAALLLVYGVGKFLLKPVLKWGLSFGQEELFTALVLLIVLATASFTALAGLSFALGAFLAGLLISETEYCYQVKAEMQPFRVLLLGLFFITVGMSINVPLLSHTWPMVLALTVAIMLVKWGTLTLVALAVGKPRGVALRLGALLAQIGEFSFVLFALAAEHGVVEAEISQSLMVSTGLSFLLSQPLTGLSCLVTRWLKPASADAALPEQTPDGRVLLVGMGNAGRSVARFLASASQPYLAIDADATRVSTLQAQGFAIVYGKPTQALFHSLQASQAKAVVVTLEQGEGLLQLVTALRRKYPHLPVFVNMQEAAQEEILTERGATACFHDPDQQGYSIAAFILRHLEVDQSRVSRIAGLLLAEQEKRMGVLLRNQ